jgi:hypothetical protein
MNIIFYHRDFSTMIQPKLNINVERYAFHMIGGPDKATLRIDPTADKWELTKLLRCPVEIYGDDGGLKWWGYIDRVTIPHGVIRVGLALDELYNTITVKYDGGTTDPATDVQSVTEYGSKEFFISLPNATLAEAEAYRDTYLATHKYAVPEIELSGGQPEIVIECYGWWHTLAWCYYTNEETDPVENSQQIADIVTACGQFVQPEAIIEPHTLTIDWSNGEVIQWSNGESIEWSIGSEAAGLSSVPTRDGSNTALAYIIELLNAGSTNARPLLAYVDRDRYLHVYERVDETTQYIMRDDGRLETLLGKLIEDENCLHAVWVRIKGVPDTLGGISAMRPFFVEWAEYQED